MKGKCKRFKSGGWCKRVLDQADAFSRAVQRGSAAQAILEEFDREGCDDSGACSAALWVKGRWGVCALLRFLKGVEERFINPHPGLNND